jgi:alpha-beta hydrolase superfamily lysophospholipase
MVRPLTRELIQESDRIWQKVDAIPDGFEVRAPDNVRLRGWKVRPRFANGDWVLLLHGVSDNRTGMTGQAGLLLRHGYSVVMMDSRAHGESGGSTATYGWLERRDTRAIVDALYATEMPRNLFALGSSMGAAIALESAGVEPRIAGVVAESSFSDLREAPMTTLVCIGRRGWARRFFGLVRGQQYPRRRRKVVFQPMMYLLQNLLPPGPSLYC